MGGGARKSARIHVWYSNQIERLAGLLIENLEPSNDSSVDRLFRQPTIVVPNRNIETYLKYEIAQGTGIAAGLKIQVPEQFLKGLVEKPDQKPAVRLATTGVLRAMFLDVLTANDAEVGPLPEVVRHYIDAGGEEPDARDLRRYQLAARLAQLAALYSDTRPELTRAWDIDQPLLGGNSLESTEKWQRELWLRLGALNGPIVRAKNNQDFSWILPSRLFEQLQPDALDLVEPIHLFGFSYIGQALREIIELLAKVRIVHIYAPSPWIARDDDLATVDLVTPANANSSQQISRSVSTWRTQIAVRNASPDRSIFKQWGQPGQDYFQILDGIANTEFHPDFVPTQGATVLGRLQREILAGIADGAMPYQPDQSLSILACTGIRREAEVVANEIWKLIRHDGRRGASPSKRLRFRDIAVLIADTVHRPTYQAHLRAVFEELHRIPFNMVDLPLAGECQTIEAVLLLLDLPMGEFTRPDLLKILTHPAVRARFPEVDIGRWRQWCLGLEIVHGADRLDHDGTYIDREAFHWDQGIRRLVLGSFMTGPRHGDDRVFDLEGVEYLPYDIPADSMADAAQLLVLVRSLVADARFARSAQLTMTEWSEFLARMVNGYLAADSDNEQRALSQCIQKIQGLCELDVAGRTVGYRIACESLRDALATLAVSRGHYLADGVVISPLLEMRALPFRVVFLCGLGEGQFPAAAGSDPLDLSVARHMPGDVTPRDRDRYLFLETLASAREKLYLLYVSRDAQTGDMIEPSPLVHELIRHLSEGSAGRPPSDWVKSQPLRRFDDGYFGQEPASSRADDPWFSVSPSGWKESIARRLRGSLLDHLGRAPRLSPEMLYDLHEPVRRWLGLCPIVAGEPARSSTQRLQISFRDIGQFLACPLQGWARLMLQFRQEDDDDESMRQDEPFVIGRRNESALLREVFLDVLSAETTIRSRDAISPYYDKRAEQRARRGLMPVGLFKDAERRRHLDCLEGWFQAARQDHLVGAGRFSILRFGRASEDERVDRLESSIPLDVPLPGGAAGPAVVRVELYGRTELVARELPGSVTPVVRDKAKDKDFLAGFLDAVILSQVAGHHDPSQYQVHVLPASDPRNARSEKRILRNIDATRGRQFLIDVVADLLGGPHAYLLPCEAVFSYIQKGTPINECVEKMKDDSRTPCSSRYGPVPGIDQYQTPDEDEARHMVDRRFGLLRDCGGIGG